jgi:hypothetical protein
VSRAEPTLKPGANSILRVEAVAACQLPDPEETWTRDDAPDALRAALDRFVANGIVRVETRGYNNQPAEYRTHPGAPSQVATIEATLTRTPCGHKGVRNLRDGAYSCTNEDCDAEFGREVAEAVVRGDGA